MICDICQAEVKNLGLHKYQKHKESIAPKDKINPLVVDEITEKPLSTLLSEMKNLVKTFRNEMDVRISNKGGRTSEVEIRVRIQL